MKPSLFAQLSIILCITILFPQQISFAAAAARKGSIEDVCSHTKDPDLCLSVLRADTRSLGGSLRLMCVVILEKVLSKSDGLKNRCPDAHTKLVADVGEAVVKLQSGDSVPTILGCIKNAIKDVVSCFAGDIPLVALLNIALSILKLIR